MVVPEQLTRYQIMDLLGAGGQGRTFRAVDRQTNREVAIKVLRLKDLDSDWKGFDLFERECATLAKLKHPGIPRFLDRYHVESTGEFFLVMELIDGQPLARHVRADATPLTDEQLVDILWKALDILGYLHGRTPPVVHRDVKPHNLLQRRDGSLALIDFGGVRASLDDTGGSTMIGTFGYMAPEQLHGEATPATDVYALAATIAALGTGTPADKLPHDGLRIALGETRLKRSRLRPVLDRMLEPVPSRRLQTAADVRRALMAAVHDNANANAGAARAAATPPRRDDALVERPEQAPAEIPNFARQIARAPAPFNIIVWIWAALVAGLFVILEVALLPAIYSVLASFSSKQQRANVRQDREKTIASIRAQRRTLQYVAARSHPLREENEKKALDRGDD